MKKTKIYLDTSAVSYLQQEDSPEKTEATNRFWNKLKKHDDVDIYMSDVTFAELNKCHEPKLSFMKQKVKELEFVMLKKDEEAERLADKIIELGILTEKSRDDCYHIAIAVLEGCNYIVSWNFKHLVNVNTINGVRAITNLRGYSSIDIVSPEMMFQEADDE
ncbi:MAG: PIN domain-containing protein [Treponema sp.]|nr:PIN domain-containing protein [Treponema sp.]